MVRFIAVVIGVASEFLEKTHHEADVVAGGVVSMTNRSQTSLC
jgi:hypothetical protein